jgi:SSS family solute:Na+ symporter
MSPLDWIVLLGTILGIAAYGTWRTRHTDNLNTYLKGNHSTKWGTIGLSVMATQASTITYLSLPGQAYENGIAFIQNYFGLPLALILVCAVFLPIYRKLGVYTAYEYLGKRFDQKTRLLGAGLFLLQRGIQAGITIYAPAIILSTAFGWRLDLTIVFTGLVAIVYTVTGGSAAVNLTQKWQMAVIFGGMVTAFLILLSKLPDNATHIAGVMGKLQAVDYTPDPKLRYTFWSGLLGGFFLSLSYFGTDQTQVQRYIGGAALREGRLGLMFNALFKIPMQFFIVMLGALLFVFYQFQPDTPLVFNQSAWQRQVQGPAARSSARWRNGTPSSTPPSRRRSARGPPRSRPATPPPRRPPAGNSPPRKWPPTPSASRRATRFTPPRLRRRRPATPITCSSPSS